MRMFSIATRTILTPTECKWIAEFQEWTTAQQAEAIELLREWTKDGQGLTPSPRLATAATAR